MPPQPKDTIYKNLNSQSAFIQADGPNTAVEWLGDCLSIDDIPSNFGGVGEQVNKISARGAWANEGFTTSAPDGAEVNVTLRLREGMNVFEKELARSTQCGMWLYTMARCGGVANSFSNWDRARATYVQRIPTLTHQNIHKMDEDMVMGQQITLAVAPQTYNFAKMVAVRQSVSEAQALNDLAFVDYTTCATCEGAVKEGDVGMLVADSAAGPATANVLYGTNGATFTATATDPFAADEHVSSVVWFEHNGGRRFVVARGTTDAAAPAEVAYTNDEGATWTAVNVGSTNGQYFTSHQSLFAFDAQHIWAVTVDGFIYFSEDGGVSWSTQDAGTTTTEDLNAIHFYNYNKGYAAGVNNALVVTYNGGVTWSTLAASSAQAGVAINSIAVPTLLGIQLAYNDGDLYTSNDGGDSWSLNIALGGALRSISYCNELHGIMARNSAGPVGTIYRTINGGKDWFSITTPTNSGLNSVQLINDTLAWAVGEANGGTAVLLKIYVP